MNVKSTKTHKGSCRLVKLVVGKDRANIFRCLDCGKEIR